MTMTDMSTATPLTTKAVLFHTTGDPDVLTVEEVPLPAPGPGEVLIRVEALGLNRAEALFRAGTYFYRPTRRPPATAMRRPESSRPSVRG